MTALLAHLIVLPVMIVAVLSFVCAVVALASPRVFRRPWLRVGAGLAFLVYFVMVLMEAAFVGDVGTYVSIETFVKWMIQIIPPAMCLWLMQKLEKERCAEPMKTAMLSKLTRLF